MDFYFINTEDALTQDPQSGGLGLSDDDIQTITVWQKDVSYRFSWHTGTHGDPCVYNSAGWLDRKEYALYLACRHKGAYR